MDAETSTRTRRGQGSRPTREDAGVTRGAIQLDPADGAGLLAAIRAVPGATRLLDAVAETGAPAYLVGGAVMADGGKEVESGFGHGAIVPTCMETGQQTCPIPVRGLRQCVSSPLP